MTTPRQHDDPVEIFTTAPPQAKKNLEAHGWKETRHQHPPFTSHSDTPVRKPLGQTGSFGLQTAAELLVPFAQEDTAKAGRESARNAPGASPGNCSTRLDASGGMHGICGASRFTPYAQD